MTEHQTSINQRETEMWMNALRGRPEPGTPPKILEETELLRGIFLRHVEQTSRKPSESQVKAFLARLQREGLLRARHQLGWFAVAAGIGFAAFGLALTMQVWKFQEAGEIEETVMRGSEQAQRIQAADPGAQASAIENILTANGIESRRVAGGKSVRLQAKVPPQDQTTRSQLAKIGIAVPEHGRLDILLTRP